MKFGGAYGTAVLGSGGFGAAVGPIDHGRSMGENEESTEATEDEQHSSASSAQSARGLTGVAADPADGKYAALGSDNREDAVPADSSALDHTGSVNSGLAGAIELLLTRCANSARTDAP